jgi:hypothetical protein
MGRAVAEGAKGVTLHKSMLMGMDECLIALGESLGGLTDEQFQRFALTDHMNIATLAMHCLQQVDQFNAELQQRRGIRGPMREWHFMMPEERFGLWGLPREKLPKAGQAFPPVAEVVRLHQVLHQRVIENMQAMSEEQFVSRGVQPHWPRLSDLFFRATYHINSHIRQIWFLRGVMGVQTVWPVQHYE